MKITLTKKDVVWSYIGTIMSMGSNLLILPFILYFLDEDMFGLWGIFASIGTIATLFDFGFSVTFARNITYCWSGTSNLKKEGVIFIENHEVDFKLMKCVLTTCKRIYLLLSSIALIIMLTIGTGYVFYVSRTINGYIHFLSWIIYSVAAFLNLYYGYFASFLRGVGAVDEVNINTVIARSVQIVSAIILLFLGAGITGVCIAYLLYGSVFRLLGKYKFYRYNHIGEHLEQVTENPSKDEQRKLLGIVWHNAWRDGAISICNYFCNQASTIICSMYLSLPETGTYSLGVQIASAIAQISGALYNAYQPELQGSYIRKDMCKTKKIMSVIVVTFIYLFLLGTAGVVLVGLPILKVIKPASVVSTSILLGLCLYQFMLKFRNCYTSYFSCTNRIIYLKSFFISSVVCIILSFILCGSMSMGIWGLIAAQIISQVSFNVWYWPFKAHKEMGLSAVKLMKMGNAEVIKMLKKYSSFWRR